MEPLGDDLFISRFDIPILLPSKVLQLNLICLFSYLGSTLLNLPYTYRTFKNICNLSFICVGTVSK